MSAEIISVGTELLLGEIANTDAQDISECLAELGLDLYYHTVVGDNPQRLRDVLRLAKSRSDLIITTGGLGPTYDDLTKEVICETLGLPLELHEPSLERMRGFFADMGREMTENNIKQAYLPHGCTVFDNDWGTAPGCAAEADGVTVVMLPGPPRELYPMFTDHVLPYLSRRSGVRLHSRELRAFGMGEAELTYRIRDIIANQTNPTVAPYVKTGEVTLRVTAQCRDEAEGERLVAPMIEAIQARVGSVLYSTDGEALDALCVRLLRERGETLSVAESCTGGLLASAIVDNAGSSACFFEGAVTYSNEAKMRRLGVTRETLDAHGAVSDACAREMAAGMRAAAGTTYALATTGIAGPDGGTAEKPVGLVYVALASPAGVKTAELHLTGDRARIRALSVLHALDLLRRSLLGLPDRR